MPFILICFEEVKGRTNSSASLMSACSDTSCCSGFGDLDSDCGGDGKLT